MPTKSKAEQALDKAINILKGNQIEQESKIRQARFDMYMAEAKYEAYGYAVHTLEAQKEAMKRNGGR